MNPIIFILDALLIAAVPFLLYGTAYAIDGAFVCTELRSRLFLAVIGGIFLGYIPMWLSSVLSCLGRDAGVNVLVLAATITGCVGVLFFHRKLA